MLKLTNINTDILEWALNYSAKGTELTAKFPKLSKWLNKEDFPTVRQLEQFAKATKIPFGYFFLEKEPEIALTIPYFRTLREERPHKFSPELIDTVKIIERRKEWLRDYLIINGADELRFVNSENENADYIIVAQKIKEELKLDNFWASSLHNWEEALNYLIDKAEAIGINVIRNGIVGNNTHRKLDYKEFRGFALIDNYAPFLFINGSDFKAAQLFTFAHELAHVWIGSSAIFDLRQMLPAENKKEILCNKIAAEFLLPEKELMDRWDIFRKSDDYFQEIARVFKVSELVAARRLLDLGLINKDSFFEFYNDYIKKIPNERKRKKGGDYYNTQPLRIGKRFANIVITATKKGDLLYRDAYKLTGLSSRTFTEFENKFYNP